MSIQPLITFKAGKCDVNLSLTPPKVKPTSTPGFLYLYYSEDDLVHFCWRARDASLSQPEMDLTMIPTDGTFRPYTGPQSSAPGEVVKSPVAGRIFVLKFSSSGTRHFFWLQSREQPAGDPSRFSTRDIKLGQIVDNLLQGGEMDGSEITELRSHGRDEDGDDAMEDMPSTDHATMGSGSAGADATGGDVRQEGEESREGGADGGRAPHDLNPGNDLRSLLASITAGNAPAGDIQRASTTLPDLLTPASTIGSLSKAPVSLVDDLLLQHLPSALLSLENNADVSSVTTSSSEQSHAALSKITDSQKRHVLERVLRSPQFSQALSTVTAAIRDGGLPSVSEALGIEVEGGGYANRAQGIPLTGGAAVEAFLAGVKKTVERDL